MSKTITITESDLQAMITAAVTAAVTQIAAPISLEEKPAAKADGRNKAARAHNYEARIARREDSSRKGGAGMTKAEKSALYKSLQADLGRVPTTREWNAACKKVRGL